MVASIISKKLAAGSTHLLIDLPVGPTAKLAMPTKRCGCASCSSSSATSSVGRRGDHDRRPSADRQRIDPVLEAGDVMAVLRPGPPARSIPYRCEEDPARRPLGRDRISGQRVHCRPTGSDHRRYRLVRRDHRCLRQGVDRRRRDGHRRRRDTCPVSGSGLQRDGFIGDSVDPFDAQCAAFHQCHCT